jgi:hypothetical protein
MTSRSSSGEGKQSFSAEEIRSKFDRQLFALKLREPSHTMQIQVIARRRKAQSEQRKRGQGDGAGLFLALVQADLEVLRDFLEEVDRICRDVWETQGYAITPEFVRAVLAEEAFNVIEIRTGVIESQIELTARRTHLSNHLFPARSRLTQAKSRLKATIGNRYEIEARGLEHNNAHKHKPKLPEPIRPVRTGFTSAKLTMAPAPPSEVRGLGLAPYQPKSTDVPHEPPMYFLSDLWPKTNVILLKAQREFPLQTQTFELCKRIVSEMTPLFVEAVRAGQMNPASVLREHGGGMEDLLRLLLIRNDPGPHSGWGISNAAYRFGQEVRALRRTASEQAGNRWNLLPLRTTAKQRKTWGQKCQTS